jgi:hypothetical protein
METDKDILTPEEFLIQHLTENKSYQQISDRYPNSSSKLSEWWNSYSDFREKIRRSNSLYHSKTLLHCALNTI